MHNFENSLHPIREGCVDLNCAAILMCRTVCHSRFVDMDQKRVQHIFFDWHTTLYFVAWKTLTKIHRIREEGSVLKRRTHEGMFVTKGANTQQVFFARLPSLRELHWFRLIVCTITAFCFPWVITDHVSYWYEQQNKARSWFDGVASVIGVPIHSDILCNCRQKRPVSAKLAAQMAWLVCPTVQVFMVRSAAVTAMNCAKLIPPFIAHVTKHRIRALGREARSTIFYPIKHPQTEASLCTRYASAESNVRQRRMFLLGEIWKPHVHGNLAVS